MISVCIFGSQARQTADPLSDRDLLLIADEGASLHRAAAYWTSLEWNVSTFERRAFARIAEVRSLFVQHIKQEGRIVKDDGGFLASVLEGYLPKSDYKGERNDALRQIASLPPPKGAYWHDMCLADATYVLLRNAIILHLACQRVYCFQYDELVSRFGDEFGLLQDERLCLLHLRNLKHAYRRRVPGYNPENAILSIKEFVNRLNNSIDNFVVSSIESGNTTEDYYYLRMLELDLLGTHDISHLDSLRPGEHLFDVWRRVTGAGGYPKERIRLN